MHLGGAAAPHRDDIMPSQVLVVVQSAAMPSEMISFECRRVEGPAEPEDLLDWLAGRRHPVWLDSAAGGPAGRYSILAADPVGEVRYGGPGDADPFEAIDRLAAGYRLEGRPPVPFVGGLAGWIGYEAGRCIERIADRPARPSPPIPCVWMGLYDTVAVFDHHDETWTVAGIELPETLADRGPSLRTRLRAWSDVLAAARPAPPLVPPMRATALTPNMSFGRYRRMIERALEYIAAGDIYQVNLAQQFELASPEPPPQIYRRLRRSNRGAYAALIGWGDRWVLSSSPELFLDVRDGGVVTRPIKGTAPRWGNPLVDDSARRRLLASEKDRAELNMIIDLERNDLGRVCRLGSVQVAEAHGLEEHPTVFHLVGTVRGELAEPVGTGGLLRATFPGGSITGAPKIRAMQIIDELEPTGRGVYCGGIGWIAPGGDATLNIAIRTMTAWDGRVVVPVGGGIVADSTPPAEFDETLAKARGMLAALGADHLEPSIE